MLILHKTIIKTTFLLLLFTAGVPYLPASGQVHVNQDKKRISGHTFTFPEDTATNGTAIKKEEISQESEFIIPEYLAGTPIDFQVNSEISYLRFRHFVKNESRKIFYLAWLKEKEGNRLKVQTDSLREAYGNTSSEQKDSISALILNAEEKWIALNEEIPVLYEKAREEENRYWQSASDNEKMIFQEKIRLFQDSIRQIAAFQSGQTTLFDSKIPDTIAYYKSSPTTIQKKESSSGIIYKIEIGAYKGKVPNSAGKSIKKLSVLRQVENYTDEKGVTIYTTGNLKQYEEAVTLQNQVKQEGIKNATVTAYRNGKKITMNEARKLNKEL